MDFINKLERKIGKYAIRHLIYYLLGAFVIGYALDSLAPSVIDYLTLNPYMIIHRFQIWRLFSWIFVTYSGNIVTVIIFVLCYFWVGELLESIVGSFRFNLYVLSGILLTDIAGFIVYWIVIANGVPPVEFWAFSYGFSTDHLFNFMFMAVAIMCPEMTVSLYGIIPIRAKWLGLVTFGVTIYQCIIGGINTRAVYIASFLNLLFFVFVLAKGKRLTGRVIKKEKVKKVEKPKIIEPRHKCHVCGKTELDDPTLVFRYCSKCNGNYEYCQEHLFTHEHIK